MTVGEESRLTAAVEVKSKFGGQMTSGMKIGFAADNQFQRQRK